MRRYVVEQDYEQYTEIDHAVWRFVLLQTYARLQHTAHPAYRTGLAATGISVEAIPRIDEMHEKLSRFGWSAVCVDGFIPPRAFQGFQANRILPIAAEIRSIEHLAYTPAPDILHEAAGHAPILSEPAYAQFIQSFGAIAEKAFGTPSDRAVHQTVHALSELKEDPASTALQIQAATRALQTALASVSEVSESARLARLYWWTAEYGLVGSVSDFKLYGAGLLSSLLESHSCLEATVRKLPLSAACVQMEYDITRAQPQLFVARDFEQCLTVLEEVSSTLAFRMDAAQALPVAQRSQELATLKLDTGIELVGVVTGWESCADAPCLVQLSGAPALLCDGELMEEATCPNEYVLPLGMLRSGKQLSSLSQADLQQHVQAGVLRLELSSGATISGVLCGLHAADGRVDRVLLERFELTLATGRAFRSRSLYPLALGRLVSVCAGAPAAYVGASERSHARVPRPRWIAPREQALLSLFERAVEGWKSLLGTELVNTFEHIATALDQNFPDDWLLRWNLLESLVKVAEQGSLTDRLTRDLELLEIKYLHREPIATGLAHIRALAKQEVPVTGRS